MHSRALTIVSGLFLVSGALALVEWIVGLMLKPQVNFDIAILNLWIGRWLMQRERRGHTLAIGVSVISIVLWPIVLVLFALFDGVPTLNLYSVVERKSWAAVVAFAVFSSALSAWKYYVLTRPDIRALFASTMEPVAS